MRFLRDSLCTTAKYEMQPVIVYFVKRKGGGAYESRFFAFLFAKNEQEAAEPIGVLREAEFFLIKDSEFRSQQRDRAVIAD